MRIRPHRHLYGHLNFGREFKFRFNFPEGFILVLDSREQTPLFRKLPKGLVVVRDTLKVGDYSIRGFENAITIERKSIPDLLGSLGRNRDQFKVRLAKMRFFEWAAVVVEGSEKAVIKYHESSLMEPESIRQSICSIELRYKIPFYFGATIKDVERWVLDRLIKFYTIKRSG